MLGGGELGRQPAGDTVILRLLSENVLVHVQVGVDPLVLQPGDDGGQYVDVGLVNLERSINQYRARTGGHSPLPPPAPLPTTWSPASPP